MMGGTKTADDIKHFSGGEKVYGNEICKIKGSGSRSNNGSVSKTRGNST